MERAQQLKFGGILFLLLTAFFSVYIFFGKETNDSSLSPSTYSSTIKSTSTMEDKNLSGLIIETVKEGTGVEAKNGDKISVHYTGMLTDARVFDSSIPRGEPFTLTLGAGQVIKGWDQGLLGMKVGEKRKLTIPPEMGYGRNGYPPVIPENATLIFDVELIAIQ